MNDHEIKLKEEVLRDIKSFKSKLAELLAECITLEEDIKYSFDKYNESMGYSENSADQSHDIP